MLETILQMCSLCGYALVSNVALAVLPHEPVVIWYGPRLGVWVTALVATVGTVAAAWIDHRLFCGLLSRQKLPQQGGIATLLAQFHRAPFLILSASGLTPLPFWPFKALAFSMNYSRKRYLLAVAVGRFPRHLLLAWFGVALPLPMWGWAIVSAGLLLGWMVLRRSNGRPASAPELVQTKLNRAQSPNATLPMTNGIPLSPKEHTMSTGQPAQRMTTSFTSAWEKKYLPRMARQLPRWVTPDHLTSLGILMSGTIGLGYLLSHLSALWLLLSVAALFVHWFADSLDGTLARVRNQARERYGYYVDRTADAISTAIICTCFGLSPFIRLPTGMLLAVAYLLLQIYAEVCAYTANRFPLSFMRLGPTEVRIVLAALNLALIFWRPTPLQLGAISFNILDVVIAAAAALMIATYAVMSIRGARRLNRIDQLPQTAQGVIDQGLALPRYLDLQVEARVAKVILPTLQQRS